MPDSKQTPPSFWQEIKRGYEEGKREGDAKRAQSLAHFSKSERIIYGVVIVGIVISAYVWCFVSLRNTATRLQREASVGVQAKRKAAPDRQRSYEQGAKAGQEQLQKNYDLGGGLPLPGGQEWFARQAAKQIQPVDEEAFVKGYIETMKTIWGNTTGWKEYRYKNIIPGSLKPGTLLYEYGMTQPTCVVVVADSERMLVRYFKNGSTEWKNVRATASEFYEAR